MSIVSSFSVYLKIFLFLLPYLEIHKDVPWCSLVWAKEMFVGVSLLNLKTNVLCVWEIELSYYLDKFLFSVFILRIFCNSYYLDINLPELILKILIFSLLFSMSFLFTLYFEMFIKVLYYKVFLDTWKGLRKVLVYSKC